MIPRTFKEAFRFKSRVGWSLAAVHFVAVVYEFAELPGSWSGPCEGFFRNAAGWVLIAGRSIHWYQESELLKALILLDLPALLFAEPIVSLLPDMCDYPRSWTLAALWLIVATVQWYMVGSLIQFLYRTTQTSVPR